MFRPMPDSRAPMTPAVKIPERRRAVLVVTPYYAAHGGGTERVAGQLIGEIAAADNFHFTWAASDTDAAPAIPGQDMLPMRALNLLENWFGWRWPLWSPRSLRKLRRAVEGVDLVWLHDTFSPGSLIAFRLARRFNKPLLITQHDGPAPYPGFFRRRWQALLDRYCTRRILRHVQQATFTSDAIGEYYYRAVAFSAPVKIIPNGIDLHVFHPALAEKRAYLRGRFALRDDQPVLLFAGRFTAKNGLPVIRHLAQMLPGWRFWLAGDGPINPERWFLPNVQIFKSRRGAALAELYQSADFLILPGYGKTFPLAAQEAMACGLPVMCSPAIASGSQFAKPYLWTIKVEPGAPERTAELWAKKLRAGQPILPLAEAKTELSDLAQSFWESERIAGYYADILRGLCKKPRGPIEGQTAQKG